ncbi:hypothetical protein EJ07DRAFT_104049 [Lizonia empirigonia]|nr:hypothetical protein EJ07DRAFT_104049 [Lizonia empirigonia]
MSFSNLLAEPAMLQSSSPGNTADIPVLEPPSTPSRRSEPAKDETASPVGSMTSELTEIDVGAGTEQSTETVVVDDDEIEREFICMNDEYTKCRTGQYTLALSRKVISDHFGRNKACTRDLTDWPLFCRKHYQRATYNKELWQVRKVKLILRQFDVIENEFPGTTYDITLKKSEEDRLNEFSRKIAAGMSAEQAAATVVPVAGKAFEAPIDVLRELDQYIGKGKTIQNVKDAMDVVLQMLQEKETEQVPSIEFLPKLPGKTSTPKKSPAKTRAVKSPSKSPSKGTSRTSARGAVKKTNKKA